jgi:pyruvate/2-oxoglutarate dehydrogenase complex dihydrolipoamide acyltransferase (E2) component
MDGTLAEIMVAAGDAVEYGEPVAAVDADPPGPAAADPDGEG